MSSKESTLNHKERVKELLIIAAEEIVERGENHDNSKLESPEIELMNKYSPLISELVFGSEEYYASLVALKPALDHHYDVNRHHPEHYENGIDDMDLFDIMEMFFDWKASGERYKGSNIYKSLEINKERFGISDQLVKILINTAKNKGW